jgi:hypothetical protein
VAESRLSSDGLSIITLASIFATPVFFFPRQSLRLGFYYAFLNHSRMKATPKVIGWA